MIEQDEWVKFKEIDWLDKSYNKYNIDTRDFHVGYQYYEKGHPDIKVLSKYKHFFLNKEELIELIERYFIESGGTGEWRMFSLDTQINPGLGWDLKYLRIWRTSDDEFIICDSNDKALKKQILDGSVDQKYLNFH